MNSSQMPDAVTQPHRMAAPVPGVEVADDGDARAHSAPRRRSARRRRRPIVMHIGAERLGELEVAAFAEEVQVDVAEQRAEGIRVLRLLHARPAIRCAGDRARAR